MPETQDEYVKKLAPIFARLSIWNPKFAPIQERLRGASLQKITASNEGYITLALYRPGDDRSSVVLNIKKGESGVLLTHTKPKPQMQPNSFIQVARKYISGRRIQFAYASLEPVALFIEFEKPRIEPSEMAPDVLILDLDSKPARVMIAKRHEEIPERYLSSIATWPACLPFFESFCEWSLDATKTKRRPSFEYPMITYCSMTDLRKDHSTAAILPDFKKAVEKTKEHTHEFGFEEKKAFEQKDMNFLKALSILPVHIRRAVKSRVQFLERRLLRQRADLPPESEIARLVKRGEGLRAHLYLWPDKSNSWYIPQEIVEDCGLPPFIQLQQGQKPGDLLAESFRQIDKLRRRRSELLIRLDESKKEIDQFQEKVTAAGASIETEIMSIAPDGQFTLRELGIYFSRIQPSAALALCKELEIPWLGSELKKVRERQQNTKTTRDGEIRHPYRSYRASTGEFINVARSAQEGDAMIKLMPSHHMWLHVLSGEGSHVWLEKPKKAEPSAAAVREAAILAIHNSKLARGKQGEVRLALRHDIEKKKDLPPGKVLVRRCKTIVVKYENDDIESISKRQSTREH